MATAVSTLGKYQLFYGGWTSKIGWARLYDITNTLINQQSVTFSYSSATGKMTPTSTIVFTVAAETVDAAYIELGYTSPYPLDEIYYTKDLPALYDFPTEGTLTVNSWDITIGGTYIQIAGRDDICDNGWESLVTWVKLYTAADGLINTQSVSFTSDVNTGIFSPTANIVFEAATGDVAYYMAFGYTSGTDVVLYKRFFSTSYTFTTAGRLTIDSWEITI